MLRWMVLVGALGAPGVAWATACSNAPATLPINCEGGGARNTIINNGTESRALDNYNCATGVPEASTEKIFSFTCAQTNHAKIVVDQTSCDVDLYVLSSACTAGSCLGVDNAGAAESVVEMTCVAGQQYYIVVEGWEAYYGNPYPANKCPMYGPGTFASNVNEGTDFRVQARCDEICNDGFDNDRDSLTDCADPDCYNTTTCCDFDLDGWLRYFSPQCTPSAGTIDCNDSNGAVNPAAYELPADGVDQDCDGVEDCYPDYDGDSYGTDPAVPGNDLDCIDLHEAGQGGDCDDGDALVHPGVTELVGDEVDEDCDGHELCYSDVDGDGYGVDTTVVSVDADCQDAGEATVSGDCAPGDRNAYPGALEIVADFTDQDCDGKDDCWQDLDGDLWGTSTIVHGNDLDCAGPRGEAAVKGDCNDGNAGMFPGNPEIPYDGIDQDCSGADLTDVDQDGYAGGGGPDCNDTNPAVHPGATEIVADGVDQDCDGGDRCWTDNDHDHWGTAPAIASPDLLCTALGEASVLGDCDDAAPGKNPGATEVVGDGIDQDCSGGDLCYVDDDADGWGTTATIESSNLSCADARESTRSGDCDDLHAAVRPDATEVVGDGVDQDCDAVDSCFKDGDRDGYGSTVVVDSTDLSCVHAGLSEQTGDCDDVHADAYPGGHEVPYDGIDQDCSGADLTDVDADGFAGGGGTDCNDRDPSIHPGATEGVADGVDQDCDGGDTCVRDADQDGYGGTGTVRSADLSCTDPGEATSGGDCRDDAPNIHPGAPEVPYDGVDQDCSGADLVDVDGDGFPGGLNGTDCNDHAANVNPTAAERANGGDDNCNGTVDEGTRWGDDDHDGFTEEGGDCNDASDTVHPGATEKVNGVDDDCDGTADEGTLAHDDDGDGYCEGPTCTDGALPGDCNDADGRTYPGAVERPGDGRDRNCDGALAGRDADHDGYAPGGGDCADTDPTRHPGVAELPNGIDDDCDGVIDNGTLVRDDDGDGACETAPCVDPGKIGGDCDDADPFVGPTVTENPTNGRDDDCDGVIDEGGSYVDDDGDGFSEDAGDCDDADPLRFPWATELANGVDDDCDGVVDDGLGDVDGDGWTVAAGDCNDNSGWANPERGEVCDGIDNNCDGRIDEGCADNATGDTDAVDPGTGGGCGCATGGAGAGVAPWGVLLGALLRRRRGRRAA